MRSWCEHVIAILSLNISYQVLKKEIGETGWHGACQGTRMLAQKILCILNLQTDIFLFVPVLCQDIAYIIHEKGIFEKRKTLQCSFKYIFIYIYFLDLYI